MDFMFNLAQGTKSIQDFIILNNIVRNMWDISGTCVHFSLCHEQR